MKVIEKGSIQTERIRCDMCGSLLEYDNNDVYTSYKCYEYRYGGATITNSTMGSYVRVVRCPVCANEITVGQFGSYDVRWG